MVVEVNHTTAPRAVRVTFFIYNPPTPVSPGLFMPIRRDDAGGQHYADNSASAKGDNVKE
jgi:hypothetical protein